MYLADEISASSRPGCERSVWRGLCQLLFPALLILLAFRVEANPAEVGEWGPLIEGFPVPAVHSLMLHTGKILFFRGDGEDEGGVGDYRTHLMNLDTFEFETFQMDANLFCSGHSYLPDGRVLVTGGEKEEDLGPVHVHIFDPITEQWYRQPNMRDGRYYPTNVALGDGTTLIFAGRDPDGGDNPNVERFIPGGGPDGGNVIEYLDGSDKAMTWYPRTHLLPNGRVVRVGQEQETFEFDPTTHTWDFVANNNHGERYWGTSVMLPPGFERILILGGVNRSVTSFATNTAEIIDLSDPLPTWRYTNAMNHRRLHVNVLVLPDGKVLVAGGTEDLDETLPVFPSEIFDPVTETWTEGPSQASVRLYHSTSVLLPDGRVMWLGAHTQTGGNSSSTAQIYSPAYLFNGPRPTVQTAPDSADYSETFLVDTPDAANIASVVFIRPSATTHSFNQEQRYVPLDFSQLDANTLEVTTPSNPNTAPPGYYMMFIVDSQGIPSEAPFVRLGGDLPPVVEAGLEQDIILPAGAQLDGTIVGYGNPASLTSEWTAVSGPGAVAFTDPNSADTTVNFFSSGLYTLRLTAFDGPFTVSDTVVITVHPEGRVTVGVAAATDDAEEKANGTMSLTSLDLEMLEYDAGGPHNAVGLRFNGVGIANGTQISNAYIQFTAAEADTLATDLTIEGEDVDHALGFTSSLNDLTSRTKTTAAVSWPVAPWTAGDSGVAQQTVNIAPVIQEIVNRPGWSEGNSLVLVLSGAGSRVAVTYDLDPAGAAKLYVDPAGSQACDDGVDNDADGLTDFPDDPGCTNVADPSEREISRICDDGLDNDGDGLIDYPADSGCVSPIDGSESEFEALCIDGLDNDGDGLIDFPDDPGCEDGDDNTETSAGLICDDGDDNDNDGLIDYPSDPGCDSPTDLSEIDSLIILDIPLVAGTDDAEEKADGSCTVTSLDLEMFDYDAGGPHQAVGVRFPGVSIPYGAEVSKAYIQFKAAESDSIATVMTIEGQAVDDAPGFTTSLNDITLRARTLSSVSWSPAPWIGGDAGPDQRTDDIAAIIDEIVNRSGWVQGNSLAFILSGAGERVAATYNASPNSAPHLHVEFTFESAAIDVPNVVGQVQATAEANIGAAGLTVGNVTTASSGSVPAGSVISQNPAACTACVAPGSSVDLVVSLGPAAIDVPNVVGQAQATAEANIVAAGLIVGTVLTANSGTVPAGDVISQSPVACGACALSGDAVDLVVSLGPAPIDVPDVTGQAQATAEANIVVAGLSVGIVTTASSGSVPAGDVISQSPAACTACVAPGSSVDLVVSLGPAAIDVPNVVGQAQATAEANIVAAGLIVGTVLTANSGTVPAGDVISQSPVACAACVAPGSSVDLVVSLGPAVIDVPNVVGQVQATAEANIVAAGLIVGNVITAYSNTIPAGNVISQSPVACSACALSGDAVDLVVSLGPAPIDVPDVTGQAQATAEANIVVAGLSVGIVTTTSSGSVPAGDVISQNPAACTACVAPGSAVDLVVSTGAPNTAPSVSITGPANDTTVVEGTVMTLTGTANDDEDGDLGANLIWSSNKDGVLGTGTSVATTLSKGRHTITATVTDGGGLSDSDRITVRVRKARR